VYGCRSKSFLRAFGCGSGCIAAAASRAMAACVFLNFSIGSILHVDVWSATVGFTPLSWMASGRNILFACSQGPFFVLFHLLSKIRGWQSRLCLFYDEAVHPSLPFVQRGYGNSDSRSGEKCSTYPWALHEMRLRLSVGDHSIVGDIPPHGAHAVVRCSRRSRCLEGTVMRKLTSAAIALSLSLMSGCVVEPRGDWHRGWWEDHHRGERYEPDRAEREHREWCGRSYDRSCEGWYSR